MLAADGISTWFQAALPLTAAHRWSWHHEIAGTLQKHYALVWLLPDFRFTRFDYQQLDVHITTACRHLRHHCCFPVAEITSSVALHGS